MANDSAVERVLIECLDIEAEGMDGSGCDRIEQTLDACLEWHLVLERIERDRDKHWEAINDGYDTL